VPFDQSAEAKDEDEIALCIAVCAGSLPRDAAIGKLAARWGKAR
jgi:hypothetical protein